MINEYLEFLNFMKGSLPPRHAKESGLTKGLQYYLTLLARYYLYPDFTWKLYGQESEKNPPSLKVRKAAMARAKKALFYALSVQIDPEAVPETSLSAYWRYNRDPITKEVKTSEKEHYPFAYYHPSGSPNDYGDWKSFLQDPSSPDPSDSSNLGKVILPSVEYEALTLEGKKTILKENNVGFLAARFLQEGKGFLPKNPWTFGLLSSDYQATFKKETSGYHNRFSYETMFGDLIVAQALYDGPLDKRNWVFHAREDFVQAVLDLESTKMSDSRDKNSKAKSGAARFLVGYAWLWVEDFRELERKKRCFLASDESLEATQGKKEQEMEYNTCKASLHFLPRGPLLDSACAGGDNGRSYLYPPFVGLPDINADKGIGVKSLMWIAEKVSAPASDVGLEKEEEDDAQKSAGGMENEEEVETEAEEGKDGAQASSLSLPQGSFYMSLSSEEQEVKIEENWPEDSSKKGISFCDKGLLKTGKKHEDPPYLAGQIGHSLNDLFGSSSEEK